jgi:outer membrane immunogenic protein
MAPLPLFDWSGFYVGLNGGWGWGRSRFDFDGSGLGTTGDFGLSGGLIGGTIGYNYQAGGAVFGLEADLDWARIRGSDACPVGSCVTTATWLSTVRGRLGFAMDRFLPYLTAGAAFGNVRASVPGVGTSGDIRTGWTVGGGVEYAMNRNWSLKAEYLYVDLGKFNCGAACGVAPPTDVSFKSHIVRGGVNFRF